MKLNVHEIEEAAKALAYEEPTEPLNGELVHGGVCDFEFHTPAAVTLEYYRAGQELFFQGHINGPVIGHCARCTEEYTFEVDKDFTFVLVPRPAATSDEEEISKDEVDLGYYDTDLVDLTPVVREQIILALPTRPLCDEQCKGLCPTCGSNLNTTSCSCTEPPKDPRLAVLRQIKLSH